MKDRLFLDTNVVIDLLGEREPFYDSAAKIATLSDQKKVSLIVSTLTYSTVLYILSRNENNVRVKEKIRKFKIITDSSDLTDDIIEKGLESKFKDFEDSLQYYCALSSGCNVLISRNTKDFKVSEIPVLTPDEYLARLKMK